MLEDILSTVVFFQIFRWNIIHCFKDEELTGRHVVSSFRNDSQQITKQDIHALIGGSCRATSVVAFSILPQNFGR